MAVSRLRLRDIQLSQLPLSVGICQNNVPAFAQLVNRAQERLLTCREAGEAGWWGSYAEVAFNASRTNPYITLPRGMARLISLNVCETPMPLQNQFYEYLRLGSGRWPKTSCGDTSSVCRQGPRVGLRRTSVPTWTDLTVPGYGLRFYPGDAADVGKRLLIGCLDANQQRVFTTDSGVQHNGVFVTLASPFVDLQLPATGVDLEISAITGIQKDITVGIVSIYQVNLTTGDLTLLLQMEPGEEVAAYTSYYLSELPTTCCTVPGATADTVQLTAMVKLDLVPVKVSTDYLLIQSAEAVIAECEAVMLERQQNPEAMAQAERMHRQAVRYLQGQLVHFEGKESPAIMFAPFGSARLEDQRIGLLQ
jgi:hypothetical protein